MSGPFPAFLQGRRDALVPSLSFRSAALSYLEWRPRAEARFRQAVRPALPPPSVRTIGAESVAGFHLTRLEATFAHGDRSEGALLAAEQGAPRRAVLLLHDHGGFFDLGWQKGFPLPEARDWQARFFGGLSPAFELAQAGFAVLSFDALGWGARSIGAHADQQALACNLLQLGLTAAGIVAAEDLALAEWASGQPWAADGLAAFGFSFGGFRAWQLAALSPRIDAAAAIAWMGRRADLLAEGNPMTQGQSAFWTLHPSLVTALDFPDMAGLAAPKPLFLRTGDSDRHFPAATLRAAHDDLRAIYAASGAAGALDAAHFVGGHLCPPEILRTSVDSLAALIPG